MNTLNNKRGENKLLICCSYYYNYYYLLFVITNYFRVLENILDTQIFRVILMSDLNTPRFN